MHSWWIKIARLAAVLVVVVPLGCGSQAEENAASHNSSVRFVPVDFQPQANVPLAEVEGLPTGSQVLGGVEYEIGPQLMQLGSTVFPDYPLEFTGIRVNGTCQAIHFLHSSRGGGYTQPGHPKHEADGVEIGRYVVHYDDGSQETIPLIYGEDLRGWWDWDNDAPTTRSQIVWTGENPNAAKYNRKIRLYWAVWENPHPEKSIAAMDFISANAKAAPFCVAMTLETPPPQ